MPIPPHLTGQDDFQQWFDTTNDIIDQLGTTDGVAGRAVIFAAQFEHIPAAGLDFTVTGGIAQNLGEVYELSNQTVTLTGNGDFAVYLYKPVVGAPYLDFAVWGSQPSLGTIVLYRVTTTATDVDVVEDLRTFADFSGTNAAGQLVEQLQLATVDGQTTFDLSAGTPQVTANNGLALFVSGARQTLGVDYTLPDANTVELVTGVPAGTRVLAVANDTSGNPIPLVAEKQSFDGLTGEDTFVVTAFDLTGPIALYVGGVRQDDDAYTIDAGTISIVLNVALVADSKILVVKSELESAVVIRSLKSGGAEGQVTVKDSASDFDTSWNNPEARSVIINGGFAIATPESLRPSQTRTETPIDEVFVFTDFATPLAPIAFDVSQAKVATSIATSGYAAEFSVDVAEVPVSNQITFEFPVDAESAAKFESGAGVIQAKVTHDTADDLQVKIHLYRVDPTGTKNNFEGTLQLIQTSTFTAIPVGTNALVMRVPSITSTVNGLVVRIEYNLTQAVSSSVKTIHLGDVAFHVGTVAWPFNVGTIEEDKAIIAARQNCGFISWFPSEVEPRGFYECDGRQLEIATHYNLFRRIGYRYTPASEQSLTPELFRVPAINGYTITAWNHGSGVDALAANIVVNFTANNTTTLTVSAGDIQTLRVGQKLQHPSIPADTFIEDIDPLTNSVVVSNVVNTGVIPATVISRIREDGTTGDAVGTVRTTKDFVGEATSGFDRGIPNIYMMPCIKY